MALDRQSIERKDFPIGRRGYAPDAVDAHLAALAEEVEELRRSSRRRTETLAASASERVRAIVEAAENSAEEIQRQAEEEAQEILSEANQEARVAREQASTEAREYVGRVSESTSTMLERLEAMENEIGGLIESIKTGGNRLNADLQLLESSLGDARESVTPIIAEAEVELAVEPELATVEPMEPEVGPGAIDAVDPEAVEPEILEPETESGKIQGDELEEVTEADAAAAGAGDDEGARLVALNMALNGTPREETERYLSENFQLDDQRSLLDEVYASVGG